MIEPTRSQTRTATVLMADPALSYESTWPRTQPPQDRTPGKSMQDSPSLDRCAEALLSAYLDGLRNSRNAPLKDFMWDLEREIILASLKMTHGHQKNSAAILGIKPTTLFQKMLKFAINPRRMKLMEKLQEPPPAAEAGTPIAPGGLADQPAAFGAEALPSG